MTFEPRTKASALGALGALILSLAPGPAPAQEDGPSSVQEIYRDWIVSCVTPQATQEGPTPQRICEMRQELRQADGGQLVLGAGLQPDAEGSGANLTLAAPFGLLVTTPVTMDIGDARVAEVPFQTCLPRGCIAATTLATETVDALAAGNEAQVSMTTSTDQTLTVTLSLAGFTAAWNRLLDLVEG